MKSPDWLQTDNFKQTILDDTIYRQYFKICWGITGIYMKWRWIKWNPSWPIPKTANIIVIGGK